ncbi:acetylglutamate kinase [Mesoterricola silvestris]|uniref:Acetylglutamate kinase n=1 Tax=Mesoterricola silvestris TaxID=2927979 RepID=A0AA48GU48_9BACT|nr:acetylglutamate kinase [Mesoterricola silvestris]BDU74102.1 acetylglutamate kinase [Mesoterricola silvestris]
MVRSANPFDALHNAAKYVRKFRGRPFVVKLGGEILEDPALRKAVCTQLALLWSFSIPIVIVHGGGAGLDALCGELGLETTKVAGRRVTSAPVLDAAKMAFKGRIQMDLLASLEVAGLPAVGLSGQDAGLVRSHKRPVAEVDYGLVGDVEAVDPAVLRHLLDGGYVPVVAPFSATAEGQVLNTNADTIAAEIASALGVEKLFFILKVPGLLRDVAEPTSLVPLADLETLKELEGAIKDGMKPKITAARRALQGGVKSVHLVSGSRPDAILAEVFTNEGSGTMLVADRNEVAP